MAEENSITALKKK